MTSVHSNDAIALNIPTLEITSVNDNLRHNTDNDVNTKDAT